MKRMRAGRLWFMLGVFAATLTISGISCSQSANKADLEIVNVSYDPTRELYDVYKVDFAKYWKDKTGETVRVSNTHAGSGKQARAVIDGMQADVVTLALAYDIEGIAKAGLVAPNWISRLPNNSAPYTSAIVFLVRKGNPKGIKDWGDLVKPGVEVITPNPQTSGGARWNYLAAWGYVLKKELGDLKKVNDPANAQKLVEAEKKAREFLTELFKHVPVLDTGARGSTLTFVQRKKGDVLLAWENEALLTLRGKADQFEMVVPSVSILAEPSVAVVDKVVDKRGTRKVAEAFLEHLYTPEGQELAAQHFYRPRSAEVLAKYKDKFPAVELFTIDDVFGGWKVAQTKHFDDGGEFDKMHKQ